MCLPAVLPATCPKRQGQPKKNGDVHGDSGGEGHEHSFPGKPSGLSTHRGVPAALGRVQSKSDVHDFTQLPTHVDDVGQSEATRIHGRSHEARVALRWARGSPVG